MKIVRHLLFCFMTTSSILGYSDVPDMSHLFEEKFEKLISLNDGYNLLDSEGPFFTYIRTHADAIAAELTYLVDHADPQANEMLYTALITMLDTTEAAIKSKTLVQPQSSHITNFQAALKAYFEKNISLEQYPHLYKIFPLFELITDETKATDVSQEAGDQVAMPALDENTELILLQSIAICKSSLDAGYQYMHTDLHTTLLKDLIISWAAFMKEDSFFEELQTKQFTTELPAGAEQFFVSFNRYCQTFNDVIFPTYSEDAGYQADDEIDDSLFIEDECAEIDFNAQFQKGRAK